MVAVFAFRKTSCDGSQLCEFELQFTFIEKMAIIVSFANCERYSMSVLFTIKLARVDIVVGQVINCTCGHVAPKAER